MNAFNMTCDAVEVTLPDYLDETLEAWVRTSVQEHLGECMRCAALVRDLRNIVREAAALPDLIPAREMWPEIASRIGTPVVPLAPVAPTPTSPAVAAPMAPVAHTPTWPVLATPIAPVIDSPPATPYSPRAQGRRLAPLWMGLAAAALVMLTAGTTYLLTAGWLKPGAPPAVAIAVTPPGPSAAESVGVAISETQDENEPAAPAAGSGSSDVPPATAPPRSPRSGATTPASPVSRTPGPTEVAYEREIDRLQAIMTWRKAQLDPSTAAIIEKNLRIIDAAITESKAALRRDPASSMLSEQLTHALDKKVELLRTAAMLAAST